MPRRLCAALVLLHAAAAHAAAIHTGAAHAGAGYCEAAPCEPAHTSAVHGDDGQGAATHVDDGHIAVSHVAAAAAAHEADAGADNDAQLHGEDAPTSNVSAASPARHCYSCGPESDSPEVNCSQRDTVLCPPDHPRCASVLVAPNVTSLGCGAGAGGRCVLSAGGGAVRLECTCDADLCNAPFPSAVAIRLRFFARLHAAVNATDYTDTYFNATNLNETTFEPLIPGFTAGPSVHAAPLRQAPPPPDDDEDETEGSGGDEHRPAPPAPPPRPAAARAAPRARTAAAAAAAAAALLTCLV